MKSWNPRLENGKNFPQNMRALCLVVEELLRSLFNTKDLTSYHDLERVLEDVAHKRWGVAWGGGYASSPEKF